MLRPKIPLRIDPDSEGEDRFARFRLINWWEQDRLQKAKILVVGAGALGNEILKNLALLGVGNILVADRDVVENSNLSRSVLFRLNDSGLSKAETAAKAAKALYPGLDVQWFHGDVVYDLGLGVFAWADLVITGLDNREARLSVNRSCWKTSTPWIDGGIEQLSGIVRVFIPPHGTCYECTLGKADWEILKARRGCNLLTRDEMLLGKVPTTPTSASIIAGIQCQEAVKLLHGLGVLESKGYIFNGLTHDSYVVSYPRKENCLSHETWSNIRRLNLSTMTTTLGELLAKIKDELGREAVLEFNNEILCSLGCTACDTNEEVFKPLGKVSEKEGICPECGNTRHLRTCHSITGSEDFLFRTFAEVGIPLFDVVAGRNGAKRIYLEFDLDSRQVLGPLHSGK
jgi:adenylyltransferase/sulfurtransferase